MYIAQLKPDTQMWVFACAQTSEILCSAKENFYGELNIIRHSQIHACAYIF